MTARRLFPAQWRLAVAVLDEVTATNRAADGLLQAAFRERRTMGARDRALVGALVYGVLRDLRRLQRIANGPQAAALCALHALEAGLADVPALCALGCTDAAALADRLRRFDTATLSPAERLNVPDFIYAHWREALGEAETERLGAALRAQANVDLRVNLLKATREQARKALAAAGIEARPTPFAPQGLRLQGRAALQATPAWRDGWIEPQDEGSQLLAALVAAQAGERIADYCAGAGGKTLAIAAAMQDRGELWALDVDAARLQRLPPRAQRAGLHCLRLVPPGEADAFRQAQAAHLDAVLVDAPCSGTGTWRRQPEARLKALDLPALTRLQSRILDEAAQLVRRGGRLVYATCSLLAAENDGVVQGFLARNPDFEALDAGSVLARQGVALPGERLQLWPHRHGTDGFFGAVMRRR